MFTTRTDFKKGEKVFVRRGDYSGAGVYDGVIITDARNGDYVVSVEIYDYRWDEKSKTEKRMLIATKAVYNTKHLIKIND
jgi:hypothetical protein